MSNQSRPWWADRSRRVRVEVILVALLVEVGGSFIADTNSGEGGTTTTKPTAVAAAPWPSISQAPLPVPESTAPSFTPEVRSTPSPTNPTSPPKGTPRANSTPRPTPKPTRRTTPKPTPIPVPRPTDLSGTQIGKHVDLTWQASGGALAFNIYRGENNGVIALLAKGLTRPRYRDLGVTTGTSYSYQVSAVNSSGSESPRSRTFSITIT